MTIPNEKYLVTKNRGYKEQGEEYIALYFLGVAKRLGGVLYKH